MWTESHSDGVKRSEVIPPPAASEVRAGSERGRLRTGMATQTRRLNVLSVSALLPTQRSAESGVFVLRRLTALSEKANLRALRPVPWFPVVKPFRCDDRSLQKGIQVIDRRMFYIPAVLKHLDSSWVRRAIEPVLRQQLQRGELDVIDAHFGFPEGVGCFEVGQRLGVPVFITMRGVEQDEIRDRRIGPKLVDALTNCAGVVAVSESLRRSALEHGVPASQIRVIPNATDASHFRPGDRHEARVRLGLDHNRTIVISVGFLNERKGPHRLVPAFEAFRQQRPDAQLLLVGEGTYNEPGYVQRLKTMVHELGLSSAVRFVGAVAPEEMATWLQAADVFALATRREGRCNAVLEALSCGIPVVTTPAGDNEVMVAPPRNGRIVPVEETGAMARALLEVCSQTWDSQAISCSVPQRTWQDVARETVEFFQERLHPPQSSSRL